MDVIGRPHKRSRRERILHVGEPDSPADLMVALRNVEAEAGCVNGSSLRDRKGAALPSIVDGIFSRQEQQELLEAVRVMWGGFCSLKIGSSATTPFQKPALRTWDLDQLEIVFQKGVVALSVKAQDALCVVADQECRFGQRVDAIDPASRAVCLWSSLLHLATECAMLKIKLRKRPAPPGNA